MNPSIYLRSSRPTRKGQKENSRGDTDVNGKLRKKQAQNGSAAQLTTNQELVKVFRMYDGCWVSPDVGSKQNKIGENVYLLGVGGPKASGRHGWER